MSQKQSQEEDGVVETKVGPVDDETAETEVDFRPSCGTNRMPDDRPIITGAVGVEADKRDPRQTNRFGPLDGSNRNGPGLSCRFRELRDHAGCHREPGDSRKSRSDRFSFETPTPTYPGPGRQPPGAGTMPVTDRYTFGMATQAYPGPVRQSPGTGTQPRTN